MLVSNRDNISLLQDELLVGGIAPEFVHDHGLMTLLLLLVANTSLEVCFILSETIHLPLETLDLGAGFGELRTQPGHFRMVIRAGILARGARVGRG